jgi:hypothetical protein
MSDNDDIDAPHPSQIERLAFVRYLVNVGRAQLDLPEPTAASALLTFHDAVELFLQLAAERLHLQIRFPKDHFVDYWPKLNDAGKPMPFAEAMKRLNDARVSLKHRGVLPRRSDLTDFGVIVPDFLRQATPLVFGIEIDAVSLSILVADPVARGELQDAERALSESRVSDALAACASSFDSVVTNYEQRARGEDYISPFKPSEKHGGSWFNHYVIGRRSNWHGNQSAEMDKLTEELKREFESLWKSFGEVQDALRILLLGLDYRRYVRFRALTPSVYHVHANPSRRLAGTRDGSVADGQFCIEFVIESALRLQSFDVGTEASL